MKLQRTFIYLLAAFIPAWATAQQDYQKMIDEARTTLNSTQDMDPALKKQLLQLMNSDKTKRGMQPVQSSYQPAVVLTNLPKRDESRLARIPTQPFTKEGVSQYIRDLSSRIENQLSAAERNTAKSLLTRTDLTDRDISNAGVMAWYDGRPKLALFYAARSAGKPRNTMAINNLAAMLNIAGYEEKAIPLLLFVLQNDSKNSTVLNNIGRAYLGLGEQKKAAQYYLQCIAVTPTHPEANNALGCIYEEAGDQAKAMRFFEKSLEGGYNAEAMRHFNTIDPNGSILQLVAKHHKVPAYFDQFKFQVPEECYRHEDYYRVRALHRSFQNGVSALINAYYTLLNENEKTVNRQMVQRQKQLVQDLAAGKIPSGAFSTYPFAPLANYMLEAIRKQHEAIIRQFEASYKKDVADLMQRRTQGLQKIEEEYKAQERMGPMGECGICCLNCEEVSKSRCQATKQFILQCQAAAASLHKNYVDKYRLQLTGNFDEIIYWFALLGPSEEVFQTNFYNTVIDFLREIEELSKSTPYLLGPTTCDEQQAPQAEATDAQYDMVGKPDCPFDLSIPFIVGKLKLDCSSFSISGGEGIKGSYSKNFVNGQSTLSIGAGITFEAGTKGVSASIGASEALYITFDGDGNFSDTGMKFSSSAEISAGNLNIAADGGYTLGMNSGWNYTSNAPSATIKL